jgi:hypothetical protein
MESPSTPPRRIRKHLASPITPMTPKQLRHYSSPSTPPESVTSALLPDAPSQRRMRRRLSVSSPVGLRARSLREEFEAAAEAAARDAVLRSEAEEYHANQDGLEQIIPDLDLDVEVELDNIDDDIYFSRSVFFGDLVEVEDSEEDSYQFEDNYEF